MPTGTVAVINGNAAVTGSGTSFIADPGDVLMVNGTSAMILTRNTATSLTLETPWPGTTAGAATNWGIARVGPAARQTVTVNNKVSELLDIIAASADETGDPFTDTVTVNSTGNATLSLAGGLASIIQLGDTAAGVNLKYGQLVMDGGVITLRLLNDAMTVKRTLLAFGSDSGTLVSQWTTATRPTGATGMMGFNTTTNQLEIYAGGEWRMLQDNRGTTAWRGEVTNVGAVDLVYPSGCNNARIKGIWNPATNNSNLAVRTSSNGGSTYDDVAGNYNMGYLLREGTTITGSNMFDQSFVYGAVAVNADEYMPFEISVSSGAGFGVIESKSSGYTGTQSSNFWVTGYRKSAAAINAVRLLAVATNIGYMKYDVEFH